MLKTSEAANSRQTAIESITSHKWRAIGGAILKEQDKKRSNRAGSIAFPFSSFLFLSLISWYREDIRRIQVKIPIRLFLSSSFSCSPPSPININIIASQSHHRSISLPHSSVVISFMWEEGKQAFSTSLYFLPCCRVQLISSPSLHNTENHPSKAEMFFTTLSSYHKLWSISFTQTTRTSRDWRDERRGGEKSDFLDCWHVCGYCRKTM